MTDIISSEGIKKLLKGTSLPVYVFDTIDSTSLYARSLKDDFALVAADSQIAGKGRMGRTFFSPKGTGAYFSLKMPVPDLYKNVPFITTLASVAVHKAIKELYNIDCSIKWVNDIYLNNKKVSGILCEAPDDAHAIIGIGINVYPSSFPKELESIAACLTDGFSSVTRNELIALVVKNLLSLTRSLPDASFMEYYKAHSIVIGKNITCITQGTSFPATAIDINSEGALVVETADGIRTLSTGEISIRFTD